MPWSWLQAQCAYCLPLIGQYVQKKSNWHERLLSMTHNCRKRSSDSICNIKPNMLTLKTAFDGPTSCEELHEHNYAVRQSSKVAY